MNTSHMTIVPTAHLPRTDFGMPVLQDHDTNESWWSMMNPEERPEVIVRTGFLNYDAALLDMVLPEGVREPDMFDEGMAIWLHAEAIVSVQIEAVGSIASLLERPRIQTETSGWSRIHPSQYGINVDSFHEYDDEVAPHAAHTAWTYATEAFATNQKEN